MANLSVKNGSGVIKSLKGTGLGTDDDPLILERKETNSGDILAALELLAGAIASGKILIADGGGSITVDGTVDVATLPDVTIAALPDVALSAAIPAGDNNIGNVDIVTMPSVVVGSGTITGITNVVHVDDNSATLSVDDGGGSLTVDGSISVSGTVDTELTTANLDTGAGTDARAVVGLALAESGGALLVGSANPMPVSDNGGSLTVDGSLTTVTTITGITNVVHVDDNSGTLSIDDGAGSITVDGSLTTVATVTAITNVVHVDDNAGSLTVDGTVAATQSGTWNIATLTGVTNVVHVDDNSGTLSIDDGAGSITVDGSLTSVTTVTTVTGITNVVHVDDNSSTLSIDDGGGSITVDGTVTTTIGASESHLGEFGGNMTVTSCAEMTRPNDSTPYSANDVWSNSTSSTTLLSCTVARVNVGTGYIVGLRLETDKKSITPRVRVHIFNASNPTVAADNANFKNLYADGSKRVGQTDLPAMTTGADTTNSTMSVAFDYNLRIPYKCASASSTLYFLLETLDAFTPAAQELCTLYVMTENN